MLVLRRKDRRGDTYELVLLVRTAQGLVQCMCVLSCSDLFSTTTCKFVCCFHCRLCIALDGYTI